MLGYPKVKLVTDRGFYSADNVNGLYQNHIKFLMSAGTSLSFVKKAIESEENLVIRSMMTNMISLYTQTIIGDYKLRHQERHEESRRIYATYINAASN